MLNVFVLLIKESAAILAKKKFSNIMVASGFLEQPLFHSSAVAMVHYATVLPLTFLHGHLHSPGILMENRQPFS